MFLRQFYAKLKVKKRENGENKSKELIYLEGI